jgi:hypothetical protein
LGSEMLNLCDQIHNRVSDPVISGCHGG